MEELLLSVYFIGMVLMPILRACSGVKQKTWFVVFYLFVSMLVSIWSPFGVYSSYLFLAIPVFLVYLLDHWVVSKLGFKLLYILINLLVLREVIALEVFYTETIAFIFSLIFIFGLLPYKKRQKVQRA